MQPVQARSNSKVHVQVDAITQGCKDLYLFLLVKESLPSICYRLVQPV